MIPETTLPDRWLWRALFILVPLLYNPWSRWQYEPDKAALVLVLTAGLVARAFQRGSLPRIKSSRAAQAILVFVLVRWLTTATSVAPDWSLWGDPGWRNGFWMTLCAAILFLLARSQIATPEQRRSAITAILTGSALVSAYGVGQYLFFGDEVVRAASTMAHPNLLAAYLAMIVPLAVARLVAGPRRLMWIGLLTLQITCLVFTYSRAGWLAALSGLAMSGILQFWLRGLRRATWIMAGLLAAGLVALVILSLLQPLPGDAPHALQTLASLFRWKGATAQIRLLGWEASLDMIRARPVWGCGPATYGFALDWYLPPDLAPFGGVAALGRRTHNVYLETAVESGLIGLVAYLFMLGAILVPLLRGPHDDMRRSNEHAAVLAALVASLVNNFFSFDGAATMVLFWSLAGMVHAARETEARRAPALHPVPLGWVAGVIGLALAGWMVVPDMFAHRAETLAQQHDYEDAVRWLDSASDLAPTPDVFLATLGTVYADWATESGGAAVWSRGGPVVDELSARRPSVTEYHKRRALYFRRWHSQQGGEDIAQQSLDSYTVALRLSPANPDLWLDRGLMRLEINDWAGALADFEQANKLLDGYTRYYGAMSIYALASGDRKAAANWNALALNAQQEWDDWVWRR